MGWKDTTGSGSPLFPWHALHPPAQAWPLQGHREYVLATQMGFECRKGGREDCRKISKHPHCRGGCTVGKWQDRGSGLGTKVLGCDGRMIGL